jgi:TruD family tRNA pseudouridine synthase
METANSNSSSSSIPSNTPVYRCYTTLGIGSVFLESSTTLLARQYYEIHNDSEGNKSSGDITSKQGLPPASQISSTVQTGCNLQSNQFLSSEITAKIKESPSDFVVYEIGLDRSELEPGQCESQLPVNMACPDTLNTISFAIQGSSTEKAKGEAGPQQEREDRLQDERNYSNVSCATASAMSDTDMSPTEDSNCNKHDAEDRDNDNNEVQQQSAINQERKSPTQGSLPTCLTDLLQSDHLEPLPMSPNTLTKQICQLYEAACNSLGNGQFVDLSDTPAIEFPIPSQASKSARGQFHEIVRQMFPLLQSDSTSTQEANTNEKTWKIRIMLDNRYYSILPYLRDPTEIIALYRFEKAGLILSTDAQPPKRQKLKLHGKPCSSSSSTSHKDNNRSVSLVMTSTVSKEDRRKVHQAIAKASHDRLMTSTQTIHLSKPNARTENDTDDNDDYSAESKHTDTNNTATVIVVKWSSTAIHKARKRLRVSNTTASDSSVMQLTASHYCCVLHKTQMEHLVALQALSRVLRCRISDIGVAGIKDMQAETYQFVTISNTPLQRIRQAQRPLLDQGITLGQAFPVLTPLNLGDLKGNMFTIILRNLHRISASISENGQVKESYESCSESYLQERARSVKTHGFVNFFGTQRVGQPGDASQVGIRSFDIGRALLQGNYRDAVHLLMEGRKIRDDSQAEPLWIQQVRDTWKTTGGDPSLTYDSLPRGNHMSKERIILRGLKRYGKDAYLDALRCLPHNERTFWVHAYQSYVWNHMATQRLMRHGKQVVVGDLYLRDWQIDSSLDVVTESNVDQVPLHHIVLPLPGSHIKYPENEMGSEYREFLAREGVIFDRKISDEFAARGSYRYLVSIPEDVTCQTMPGKDANALDARLEFKLAKGCYATMLLRELMYTTVVRQRNDSNESDSL